MPIYEYLCEQCGARSEVLQRLSDSPLTVCESCGGSLRKLVSAPAFQFKGSGWYVTDYAKGEKATGADAKADAKTESKASGKESSSSGDSKSAGGDSSGSAPSSNAPAAPAPSSSSPSSGDS